MKEKRAKLREKKKLENDKLALKQERLRQLDEQNEKQRKDIVSINNQYQEMIKGKSKEEIEEIEKNIMDKCNQVMIKDYNEYYQEKLKEFPMMKSLKFGKKSKDKENKENTEKKIKFNYRKFGK